jgi:aldehyde:ferredoxin oxidoreductase
MIVKEAWMKGFTGNILRVNLTLGRIEIEHPHESFYRTYIGGSAMGTTYLLKNTPPKIDPLDPKNTLCFMLSVVTGSPIAGLSRITVTAKSPLTGLVGDSQAGGFWPVELKFAGFDGIVITGKSPEPTYLWVHDGQAELRDASHLWGKKIGDIEHQIKEELGDKKIEVAQIGPGGEKLIRFAAIINMANRACGRTGMGAVMGSKNLKAIAVRGHEKVSVSDPTMVSRLSRRVVKEMAVSPDMQSFNKYGTAGSVIFQNISGGLPTRNFTSGVFEQAEQISGEEMADTILKTNDTCFACSVRCKRVVETNFLEYPVEAVYGGPEYETIATFGSYCGVGNLNAISLANQICNQYGVDTISCGATIAFAMECFEKGLINCQDTGGVELRFGNSDAMISMLEQIVTRKGLGDLLAEGSVRAAERIGKEAKNFVVAVKGQEIPAHMPQVKRGLALIYAVNPFGADHESVEHDTSYEPTPDGQSNPYLNHLAQLSLKSPQHLRVLNIEKVKYVVQTQFNFSFLDTADLCHFIWGPGCAPFGPEDEVSLMQAVTGWDITLDEIQKIGERRLNLLRMFNAREGVGRDLDTLPKRLFDEPLKGGATDGVSIPNEEFEQALNWYYSMVGWDPITGIPTPEKLKELGLEWVAQI